MFFSELCPFLENESEPTDKPVSGHCLVVLNRFTFECRFRFAFSKLSRKMEKPDPHKKKTINYRIVCISLIHCFITLQPQMFTLTNLSSLRKREELGVAGVEDMISIG